MITDSNGRDDIPEELIIGRKYHCTWAKSRGMVWKLTEIRGQTAVPQTPKTRKEITTNISNLREINKNCKYS